MSTARAATRLVLLLCLGLAGCGQGAPTDEGERRLGDAERGRVLLRQFGCGGCHHIPGVAGARGRVGPPLERLADRVYLAGVLPNTPANLARWIAEPRAVQPGTAMPDMQASQAQVRDMVAYLYTLK